MVVPNEAVSSSEIPMNKAQLFQVAENNNCQQFHHNVIIVLLWFHHSFIIFIVIIMLLPRPHAIGDLGCHVHQDDLVDLVPGLDWDYKSYDMIMIMTMRMILIL